MELGYVQIQKEIYASYKEKLASLERAEAQRAAMERELAQLKQPVLYTEGKTDAAILTTAWEKLYGDVPRPFEIKSCNTLEEQDGSAGGCAVLQQLLCTARPDSPQVMIGLFDRDPAGIRAYSLGNNFEEIEPGWKRHRNKKANGLLLPVLPGKEDFARYHDLSIEFYFEKDDLETRVDGKGLKLCPFRDELKFHGVPVQVEPPRKLYLQQIEPGTKVDFAERVVPALPEASFVHFRLLFKTILKILDLPQPSPRP